MDVGTTYSGVAFAVLDPGEAPKTHCGKNGTVHAAGAEAALSHMEMEAEDEDLVSVECCRFKLHLQPATLDSGLNRSDLPALPEGKTVLDGSIETRIEFVLSHPNGWEGVQQSKMRGAAVRAGLIPDTTEGRNRVNFVTEGEARLHYYIRNRLTTMTGALSVSE
ncbi:hypothetical protein BC628DRAFT_1491150 [Trametes gibbosa]|nr:hypothetical protein BC628DRAFT_1491150 [Trametes gibbosa]